MGNAALTVVLTWPLHGQSTACTGVGDFTRACLVECPIVGPDCEIGGGVRRDRGRIRGSAKACSGAPEGEFSETWLRWHYRLFPVMSRENCARGRMAYARNHNTTVRPRWVVSVFPFKVLHGKEAPRSCAAYEAVHGCLECHSCSAALMCCRIPLGTSLFRRGPSDECLILGPSAVGDIVIFYLRLHESLVYSRYHSVVDSPPIVATSYLSEDAD